MLKKTNPLYIPREPRIATVCVAIKKLFCGKQTIRYLYLLKYCIYMYIYHGTQQQCPETRKCYTLIASVYGGRLVWMWNRGSREIIVDCFYKRWVWEVTERMKYEISTRTFQFKKDTGEALCKLNCHGKHWRLHNKMLWVVHFNCPIWDIFNMRLQINKIIGIDWNSVVINPMDCVNSILREFNIF